MYSKDIQHHNAISLDNILNEEVFFVQYIQGSTKNQKEHVLPEIHRHPYYEVIVFTEGEGTIDIDFKEYAIQEGAICLLSPSQVHYPTINSEKYAFYVLRFYPVIFDNKEFFKHISIFDSDYMLLSEKDYLRSSEFLKNLQREFTEDNLMKKFALGNLLKCFLISLQRVLPNISQDRNQSNIYSKLNTLIVENNFKIHLPSYYAKELKVSTRTLNVIIKEFSGLSSREYLSSKTLFEAKRLLSFSEQNIKEIAYSLGFEDTAYFSRFFKKATSQSPIAFREKYRKEYIS